MTLMYENANTGQDEPVLAVSLLSGSKQYPDWNKPPIISKTHLDKHVLQGILTQDAKPFHVVLTNLTTKGDLLVELFLGDQRESRLNEINLLSPGNSLVVDSQCIDGVNKALVATSHRSHLEQALGRKLTHREDQRCQVKRGAEQDCDAGVLTLNLEVTPTSENSHNMHDRSMCYWACLPYLIRREQGKKAVVRYFKDGYSDQSADETDGCRHPVKRSHTNYCEQTELYETDGPSAPKAYHASLSHGHTVLDVPIGTPAYARLIKSKALKDTQLLITIITGQPDCACEEPPTKNQVAERYSMDKERSKMGIIKPTENCHLDQNKKPNLIFTPCGHICTYTSGGCSKGVLTKLNHRCPLCHSYITAVIPCRLLGWA